MTSKYELTPEELDFVNMSMPTDVKPKTSKAKSVYSPTEEEMQFAQEAMQEPVKEDLPWYQSYLNAAKKGLTHAGSDVVEMIKSGVREDPFGESGRQFGQVFGVDITPKEFQEQKKQFAQPISEEEQLQRKEELEQRLPTNEGFVEGAIERGARLAPSVAIGQGGLLEKGARIGAAAIAGETAKKAGAGEGWQTVAEVAALSAPDLSKRLVGSNPRQQELIDFARSKGLTEAQIVPAVQEQNYFRRVLSRLSSKGQSTQDRLEESRNAINDIFEGLRSTPEAQQRITRPALVNAMQGYAREYYDLPPSIRKQLEFPFRDLMNSSGTGRDFLRFYQHANYEVTDPKRIGKFQEVTRNAIESIDQTLGREFRLTNELANNRYNAAHLLRPPAQPDIMPLIKATGAALGLFTGDYRLLKGALTAIGAQKAATAFLLNPRLQNLGDKTVRALHNNQIALANKYFQTMRKEMQEDAPEFYKETEDYDLYDLANQNDTQDTE